MIFFIGNNGDRPHNSLKRIELGGHWSCNSVWSHIIFYEEKCKYTYTSSSYSFGGETAMTRSIQSCEHMHGKMSSTSIWMFLHLTGTTAQCSCYILHYFCFKPSSIFDDACWRNQYCSRPCVLSCDSHLPGKIRKYMNTNSTH